MASSQTDPLIAGGVALATIGGVLMGVGASESAGSGHLIWANPWFAGGCALVAWGVVLVLRMVIPVILGARRRRIPTIGKTVEQRIALPPGFGRGLGALVPQSRPIQPPEPSPLQLKLVDEDWRLVGERVWVAALKVRMVNIIDKPIELTRYYLYMCDISVDSTGASFPEASQTRCGRPSVRQNNNSSGSAWARCFLRAWPLARSYRMRYGSSG